MAKIPGTYTTVVFALKCQALGKYLHARAWSYGGSPPDHHCIRYHRFVDNPVSVAKSEKSAKKLRDMIPDYVKTLVAAEEENMAKNELELLNVGLRDWHRERKLNQIENSRSVIDTLNLMMSGPIDIVKVESVMTVSETIV